LTDLSTLRGESHAAARCRCICEPALDFAPVKALHLNCMSGVLFGLLWQRAWLPATANQCIVAVALLKRLVGQ
jgi:hypothetical protein